MESSRQELGSPPLWWALSCQRPIPTVLTQPLLTAQERANPTHCRVQGPDGTWAAAPWPDQLPQSNCRLRTTREALVTARPWGPRPEDQDTMNSAG